MSLLREVIDIVGKDDAKNARTTLKKMIMEMKSFQSDARRYIEDSYQEYGASQATNKEYLQQAEHLTAEVNNMIQNIENETRGDLMAIAEDIQQYINEADELNTGLRINLKILKIDGLFVELEKAKANKEYMRTRQIIDELKAIISNQDDAEIFKRLDCYTSINVRWHVENELLVDTLLKNFDALIHVTEKTFQNTKTATMKISRDETLLSEIISILSTSNINIEKICTFLLENVFEPIIAKPVSLKYDKPEAEITLSFSLKPIVVQADNHNLRPSYDVVFDNIKKVFDCLSRLNITLANGQCLFGIVAKNIKESFLNALVNDCLTYAIPDTMDDMNSSSLTKDIAAFQAFLVSISFLGDEPADQKLIDFSQRVDVIFKKRFCLNIQKNALQIMRGDLYHTQPIDEKISKGNFPNCMVSKSVCQLIDLMENVLKEAREAKKLDKNGAIDGYVIDDIQNQLHSTIPVILERYSVEVPQIHEAALKNIPQQTALFHNNCLFLGWWFTQRNINSSDDGSSAIVANLQELGSKYFAAQIKEQRSQLITIMKEFDLTACVTDIGHQPFKTIRKCLRQLEHLQNVWQGVLPDVVYNKTIGSLVNDFCNELIRKIISMEDISSSVANSLVEICDIVFTKGPTMFEEPSLIFLNVRLWLKLQQLKMILNASLAHITEQWADGKGPLTLHYTAEEVRHLIRALFQNTSRRANALATIV